MGSLVVIAPMAVLMNKSWLGQVKGGLEMDSIGSILYRYDRLNVGWRVAGAFFDFHSPHVFSSPTIQSTLIFMIISTSRRLA